MTQTITGEVISNSMTKAITVLVRRKKMHTKYNKQYTVFKKYHVACEDASAFNIGDDVTITSCAPVSKTIRFKVVTEAVSE